MNGFSGKVAAITGAGSGMGRSLAVELARRGCEVARQILAGVERHARRARARNLRPKEAPVGERAHAPAACPTTPTKDPA
ncbi:NAD(P)-dependent dehydrogenase (short-subunit alcohol dehydrogenase family) [Burkholderia ambifaria]|nr:NAD(P)-dependent dehydrogenase (short-subunit alcohol dehydrogenase family) [Burkholderia ambifaria]